MHKRLWLFVPGFLFLLTAVVLAQTSGGVTLPWWTFDGGGGRLSGNAFTLEGTIGQPDAGTLTGRSYTLYGGFWAPSVPGTPPPSGCPDTYEPNDSFRQAKPIRPGTTVHAYICTEGEQDYYAFTVGAAQNITVLLRDIPSGQDYDLYLADPSETQVASSNRSGNADERIDYTSTTGGTYYVVVTGYSGHSTTQAYTLNVNVQGPRYRMYVPVVGKKK